MIIDIPAQLAPLVLLILKWFLNSVFRQVVFQLMVWLVTVLATVTLLMKTLICMLANAMRVIMDQLVIFASLISRK